MHPELHWNYRLCTHISDTDNKRYFGIREVHYKNDVPILFTDEGKVPKNFDYIEEDEKPIESIKWHLQAINDCLEKPILDLDNWPEEFNKN